MATVAGMASPEASLDVLVTGATGFIGRRLVPACSRTATGAGDDPPPHDYDGPGKAVGGDVSDPASLAEPLDGRRRGGLPRALARLPDFEKRDADAARAFGEAAAAAGRPPDHLHGRPRRRRRRALSPPALSPRGRGPPRRGRRPGHRCCGPASSSATAASPGSLPASWSRTCPAMVVPRWVSTRTQPIALDDVIRYLAGVVGDERALGRVFEIGGPDQMTYLEMLQVASRCPGRRSRSSGSRC